jgi:hypothetical protein
VVEDQFAKAKPFAQAFKMNYTVLDGNDRHDVEEAFGPLWGLPTTFVISRDGRICGKHMGMASKESFEKEIKSLL